MQVRSNMPDNLCKLEEIAYNLWWCWDSDARNLFRSIDPTAWEEASSNPIRLSNVLSYKKLLELSRSKDFLGRLERVYEKFQSYINQPFDKTKPSVAYFSMEYGLTEVLKIYSGGLGVLAGDYLKEASDSRVDMTAIGLLYRHGYFTQSLAMDGQQVAIYDPQNFNALPIKQVRDDDGHPLVVEVPYSGHTVHAYLWKVQVGRIALYLLDTDNELNNDFDRFITHQLYGGDTENRLRQEIMLGIGGILALKKLGIEKDVYHCNEGHAAFINVQRLVDYIERGLTFDQALEVVRASSLYTVHTPVSAGHDYFDEGLLGKYIGDYPAKLQLSWNQFVDMGREHPGDHGEKFCMSIFACNTCQEVNGVSRLHGTVSQKMFNPIWKGYFPEELHVSYVTNGVHLPTWAASEWKAVYERYLGSDFYDKLSDPKVWEKIHDIPDREIWDTRMTLKSKLIDFIRLRFRQSWIKSQSDPKAVIPILESFNPHALIVGFARRFATYKRAHLLFTDLDRLAAIVNDPQRPVQFLFAGKAHPADNAGQDLIKRVVEVSRMPQFLGKVIFLENYDIQLAKRLVSGVDVWLNTPTRPLEASGTSGQKAQMNGVLNFSVCDGWWLEGYVEGAGWALTDKRTYENQTYQDRLDAATIYNILENEIIPLYFTQTPEGYSPEWIQTIKRSFARITPRFTTKRMIDDYLSRFYFPLAERVTRLKADNFARAKEMAAWKEKIARGWSQIEVVSIDLPEGLTEHPVVGKSYDIRAVIDTKELDDKGIGIEMVIVRTGENNQETLFHTVEMEIVRCEGTRLHFHATLLPELAGSFKYAFRMFPKHNDLPHRQDFCLVRWL